MDPRFASLMHISNKSKSGERKSHLAGSKGQATLFTQYRWPLAVRPSSKHGQGGTTMLTEISRSHSRCTILYSGRPPPGA
jgi:hypothetical protein